MFILDLETSCTSQGLSNVFGLLNNIMNIICIIVPIMLILSLIIKFSKGMMNPDDKKNFPKIRNAIIAAIIVFLVPSIVNGVFQMMGEKYNVSSCWMLAKSSKISLASPKYIDIITEEKGKITSDSDDYEKGEERVEEATTTVDGGVSTEAGNRLVEVGRTQIGVPYYSMRYGPKGSSQLGFGCAMFVSYCYNQVFFGGVSGQSSSSTGFYGSTWEFWGNVSKDGYNAHNKKFVEVKPSEAKPGDVIAFLRGGDHYSSHSNCYHVGLYSGNGMFIDSSGSGTSGVGVQEHAIDINRSDIHFLRYVGR